MFGIVIVSHSRILARSLYELALELGGREIPAAYAGGVEGREDGFGTDATDIMAAVESVYSDEGVIIFADMGSALISSETALDFIDPDKAEKIYISSAPLVEGVISAAVQCRIGSSLENTVAEAEESLVQKIKFLRKDTGNKNYNADEAAGKGYKEGALKEGRGRRYIIKNKNGLHSRPASKFIKTASDSGCSIEVTNLTKKRGPANGLSLNRLSALEITEGDEILVEAFGAEKSSIEFFSRLERLVRDNFGDERKSGHEPEPEKTLSSPETDILKGAVTLSEGIASGRIYFPAEISLVKEAEKTGNAEEEILKLETALERTGDEIRKTVNRRKNRISDDKMQILETHLYLLKDPDLRDESIRRIREESFTAASAWSISAGEVIERYENIEDKYLKQRSADVRDVACRVMSFLTDKGGLYSEEIPEGAVIASARLTPSQLLHLDPDKTEGILVSDSDMTSHAAILIKSLGIPAIGGYSEIDSIREGDLVSFDAGSCRVYINPDAERQNIMKSEKEKFILEKRKLADESLEPAYTKDGKRIRIFANIATVSEAQAAVRNGAEGIGVLRTEFLFLGKNNPPSEDEQYTFFTSIFRIMEGRPVTVRLLDVGGDKIIPYMDLPAENNPFLGMRGVRIYETHRDLLKTHIRAILRAGIDNDLKIMIPMISRYSECEQAYNLINEVHRELTAGGIKHIWPVETGIMIETPAAVFMANELAGISDFFSIGTNDLTQYLLAAERGNSSLSSYSDPYDPAVLRAVRKTVLAAENAGIDVSLCGELGGDPDAAMLLIGIGIENLSMNPASIPRVKKAVRNISSDCRGECVSILFKALSSDDVRNFLKR